MKRILTALAISTAALTAVPALADDAATPPAAVQHENATTLKTANAMISYGRSKGDALAMIAGVQMMLGVTEGTTIEQDGAALDLAAVLEEAKELGKDDPLIVAKADALMDEAETKTRGACYWQYYCDWYGYCEYWWVCY